MKTRILATITLIVALLFGAVAPAQAAVAGTFGNGGPLTMTIFKQATQTISTIPPGNTTTGVSAVWLKPGRCITMTNNTTFETFKRCGVVNAYWWSIPSNGKWIAYEKVN